jgi:hypothetical protein
MDGYSWMFQPPGTDPAWDAMLATRRAYAAAHPITEPTMYYPVGQTVVWDGGRTDALGIAAGTAGLAAAASGNSALGVAAAALGFGAAVSNAADNGAFGGDGAFGIGPVGSYAGTAQGSAAVSSGY